MRKVTTAWLIGSLVKGGGQPVVKLSIATGHAMQIYNCLGQLKQL